MIGPNVTVATAGHPILPELREKAYQFNMPVHIGRNCWIGAWGSDNARRDDRGQQRYRRGQRRDKDIPPNVVAYGNPCRVAREINEHDREFYYKDRRITKEIFDEIKNI